MIQEFMKIKNIDLCLILSLGEEPNTSMVYLTGHKGVGILAVTKKDMLLFLPSYEKYNGKIKTIVCEKKKRLLENIAERFGKQKKIGLEYNKCTISHHKKIKQYLGGRYADISKQLMEDRAIKTENEIKNIIKACRVTDDIFTKICRNFIFKTEDEIRLFIEKEAKINNCELAFPPIAASAKGTREVHYNGHKKIENGFLMLDFGVKYKGYCSDMTRMLYIGKPSKKELDDYGLVLNTILGCEDAATKKNKFSELHVLANEFLGEKSKFFTHSLGHGLGLDIHEYPSLNLEEKATIKENIAFTIEPGIYLKDYGIRIEDTVIRRNNRLEILTKSGKELVVI
ncbi:MAG: Xaa-Pro peptidase family protein [Candidatus Woesearchaeota archaeon]|nr:Xaa-Pro peptidase family protein [Candidatus Woesearchaeota archaeon]